MDSDDERIYRYYVEFPEGEDALYGAAGMRGRRRSVTREAI